jgi:hypothetical protein
VKHLAKFQEYVEARRAADVARRAAADASAEQSRLERELVDAMLEAKVKSFALEGNMTVSLRKRFDCSVNKDNNDQVQQWLMDTVGDVAPFQKLVLYKPAVVEHLKKGIEAGTVDESAVPQFLNLKTTPGVTVRGWQGGSDSDE